MSEADQPRRAPRATITAEIALRRDFNARYRVNLLDLSPSGCRVELVDRVPPGTRLWISLPGIETIEGKTCWVNGFVAGVEFVAPLHPSVFDMLVRRMGGPQD